MKHIESVDVFKLIAITAVIVIHTTPFRGDVVDSEIYKLLDLLFEQISRFAVPFFFVLSGYFWGIKIRNGEPVFPASLLMGRRILVIFLAWSCIYLLPYNVGYIYEYGVMEQLRVSLEQLSSFIKNPVELVMQGTRVHLWFLMALLSALLVSSIVLYTGKTYLLVVISILLFLFGLLAKSYANTPLGIDIDFNTRNGPFFSTIFFASGYILSGKQASEKWLYYGMILFVLGVVLHFVEIIGLWTLYKTPINQDYVVGTFFMGIGAALAALSNHSILRIKMLGNLGRMTLGVYAVHFIYVDIFEPIDLITDNALWEIGYVILVLVLSVMTTLLLAKSKITKKLVA